MKICIIGASGHYGYALDAIKRGADMQIVGIAPGTKEEDISGLEKRVCDLGFKAKEFCDYNTMLDTIKPDIAVVNSIFDINSKINVEVLKRGINLFAEKPLALTLDELKLVEKAYKGSNAIMAAMFGIRYDAHFLTAKKAVEDGLIGKIRIMNAQKSYKLGNRAPFFKKRITYGGTIPWVGSHAIDWLYWFSGRRFKSVYATHTSVNNFGHDELEISALCYFKMEDEIQASVSIDYLRPQAAKSHGDDRIRIVGDEGVIEVRDNCVHIINEEGEKYLPLLESGSIFLDFVNQIRGKGKCMISGEDSIYVTKVCLNARESADGDEIVII